MRCFSIACVTVTPLCYLSIQYKERLYKTTVKLFADYELRRRALMERDAKERKREREVEIEQEEKVKKQKEWEKDWEVSGNSGAKMNYTAKLLFHQSLYCTVTTQ